MNSSLVGSVDSEGYITNENLVNQIAYDLGLATDANGSNSKVKDIRIEKSDVSLLQTYGINLNIFISLKEDQTWSESMFDSSNSLTSVTINDQNQLVIQNIPTKVEAHLGDVSISDENLTTIQGVITSAFENLHTEEDIKQVEESLPNQINNQSGIKDTKLAFVKSTKITLAKQGNTYDALALVQLSFDGQPTFTFAGSHTNWTTNESTLTLSIIPTNVIFGVKDKLNTLTSFINNLNGYIAKFPSPSINIDKIKELISSPTTYSNSSNKTEFEKLLKELNLSNDNVSSITLQLENNDGTYSPYGFQFPIKMVVNFTNKAFNKQLNYTGSLDTYPKMNFTANGNNNTLTFSFKNNYEFIKINLDNTDYSQGNVAITGYGINKQKVDALYTYLTSTLTGSITNDQMQSGKAINISASDKTHQEFIKNIAQQLNVPEQTIDYITLQITAGSSSKEKIQLSVTFKRSIIFNIGHGYIQGDNSFKATFNLNSKRQQVFEFPSVQTKVAISG